MAEESLHLPQHVAIIMDGNRRWAKSHALSAIQGHQKVVDDVLEGLVDRCAELGISYLTLWAFSTENWERDQAELSGMMQLFRYGLGKKADMLFEKGVRIRVLGELDRFPKDIADACRDWIARSAHNTRITVTFALNYGGRDEITRAFNRFLLQKREELLALSDEALRASLSELKIDEKNIAEYLDTADMPDPDLIIRPGGQFRLSGFLPWQSVYAELYFSPVLMPEFGVEQLNVALADFSQRQRRFGK